MYFVSCDSNHSEPDRGRNDSYNGTNTICSMNTLPQYCGNKIKILGNTITTMGTKHSFPVPQEEDFQNYKTTTDTVLTAPTTKTMTPPPAPLCEKDIRTTVSDFRCTILQRLWSMSSHPKNGKSNNKTKTVEIKTKDNEDRGGIKFVVQDEETCLVYVKSDTLVAVLKQPQPVATNRSKPPLCICSLTPPSPECQPSFHHDNGQSLYTIATVAKARDNHHQYVLQFGTSSSSDEICWRTDPCGSPPMGASHGWIIHQVVNASTVHNQKSSSTNNNNNNNNNHQPPLLIAHVQEDKDNKQTAGRKPQWNCRVAAGVSDPLLVVCMVVCTDRWRTLDDAFLRQASGVQNFKFQRVM